MMKRVLGIISCDLKVKGQILNFLVNPSPKVFDEVTSNPVGAKVT